MAPEEGPAPVPQPKAGVRELLPLVGPHRRPLLLGAGLSVVARGTHAELVGSSPLYRELATAQLLV